VLTLLTRFYEPDAGVVAFDGHDVRDASMSSLRQRIIVVPQEGFLFNTSIRENVRIGRPDATDAEVEAALAEIGVLERFRALPQGLETLVNERGSRLSAGEKQLVSLSRAALRDPAVLVLDEATSSLDPGTECPSMKLPSARAGAPWFPLPIGSGPSSRWIASSCWNVAAWSSRADTRNC
jgi:ABC-type multidrug transport system fused ATPase/permease subunit